MDLDYIGPIPNLLLRVQHVLQTSDSSQIQCPQARVTNAVARYFCIVVHSGAEHAVCLIQLPPKPSMMPSNPGVKTSANGSRHQTVIGHDIGGTTLITFPSTITCGTESKRLPCAELHQRLRLPSGARQDVLVPARTRRSRLAVQKQRGRGGRQGELRNMISVILESIDNYRIGPFPLQKCVAYCRATADRAPAVGEQRSTAPPQPGVLRREAEYQRGPWRRTDPSCRPKITPADRMMALVAR